MLRTAIMACLLMNLTVGSLQAEKNASIKHQLFPNGQQAQSESFDQDKLGQKWLANKGEWKVDNGVLVGKELPADKHAAVLTWQLPNQDSAVKFSFQLKGTQGFHFSLNHAKGHLFRVLVDQQIASIRTDKDKKDPKSKPQNLARAKAEFEQGQWYTMLVEMQGEKVVVQTDNGIKLEGHHPSLDTKKPGYRFVVRGDSLLIDDLQVWTK